MPESLDAKIAKVAATTVCRFCSKRIPPEAVICECRIARGELPHTEWPVDVKAMLLVREAERLMWKGTSEQSFWERLLVHAYAGTTQGSGVNSKIIPMSASVVDVFPFAAGDAALWAQSGYPTLYHL